MGMYQLGSLEHVLKRGVERCGDAEAAEQEDRGKFKIAMARSRVSHGYLPFPSAPGSALGYRPGVTLSSASSS